MFRALKSIVLFLTLLVFAAPAYADECGSRVFDSTGKANTDAIKSALNPLISDGADPMVRIITAEQINAAGGNIDKYAQGMVKRCSAWQSPGGNMKSNLLILAVTQDTSIESPVGIYFSKSGPLTALRGQTAAVRSEMASTLKSDVTASIQNGIQAMHGKLSVAKTRASETRILSNGPTTIINEAPSKPMNLTFLWVLLALGVAGVLYWLYSRKQSDKAKANASRQTAQERRAACNNMILGLDSSMSQLGALLSSFKSVIHTSEFTAMQTKLGAIQGRIAAAKTEFANMQGSANDPESLGLTAEAYDRMTDTFKESFQKLNGINGEVKALETSIRKINSLKEGAEPAIEALSGEIEKATQAVTTERILKTDGPKATLQQAITLAERANTELADKRFQAVADTCREATALAQKAAQQVRDLGARKTRVDSAIRQLDAENVTAKLITADAAISSIRTTYGETVVSQVNESRALIVQAIEQRRQSIVGAKGASFSQNWDSAEQNIAAANSATSVINSALSNIQDTGPRIEREKEAARKATTKSYRPQSSGGSYGSSRSISNRTTVNNTTVVVGQTPYYDPYYIGLDALGNTIDRAELNEERRELNEERRDMNRGWDSGSRSNNNDMDGDSGPTVSNDDMDGDSGPVSSPSNDFDSGGGGSDFSSGDDD